MWKIDRHITLEENVHADKCTGILSEVNPDEALAI